MLLEGSDDIASLKALLRVRVAGIERLQDVVRSQEAVIRLSNAESASS